MSKTEFEHALDLVRGQTKKAIFETWFSRLVFIERCEDLVRIGTPNRFVKEWIEESELIHALALALKESFGAPLTPCLVMTERDEEVLEESGFIKRGELLPPEAPPGEAADEKPGAVAAPPPAADEGWSVPLKREYNFRNYVVGPSNQLAHAAAKAVAQSPGQAYNPLFIHAASGLGKTHLLQAVCAEILEREQDSRILYLSCEDFVNQFIEGVKEGQLEGFRYKYRNVDMLLIDDIHFLADKPRIQEEFFHTFNTLYNLQKQIVLSADCHPAEIPTLEDRLVSRFKWGLVTRIDTPEYETRAAIIKKKCALREAQVGGDVIALLAARLTSNVREIEGALNRLLGSSRLLGRAVDKSFAVEVLGDLFAEGPSNVGMDEIVAVVSSQYDVSLAELRSKRRTKKIAFPRQICMYLAREMTDHTLQEIGGVFGGRDHTTVLYGIEKITKEVEKDARLRDDIRELSRSIRSRALQTAR